MDKTHYVYRLDDPNSGKFYFGSRSCNCDPIKDDYMGSPYVWKPNASNLKKKIIKSDFTSRTQAVKFEAELIEIHIDDDLNENYHVPNKGYHRSGAVTTEETKKKQSKSQKGKISVKDSDGNFYQFDENDFELKNNQYVGVAKGTVTVKDNEGNYFRVSKDHEDIKSGKLKGVTSGYTCAKDEKGNYYHVSVDDPRLKTGELIGNNKGTVPVKDKNGNCFRVNKNDPRYLSGSLIHNRKGIKPKNPFKSGKKHFRARAVRYLKTEKTYDTVTAASKNTRFSIATISAHCQGKRKKQKFEYVEK